MSRRRKQVLAAITVLCVAGGALYLVLASLNPNRVTTDAQPRVTGAATELGGSQLMVRAADREDPRLNGQVFVVKNGRPPRVAGRELAWARGYLAPGRGLGLATASTTKRRSSTPRCGP